MFAAIASVSAITGETPFQFSSNDWFAVANALWVAVFPVLVRYFNKKDPAFGQIVESIGKEVDKKLKKKTTKTN